MVAAQCPGKSFWIQVVLAQLKLGTGTLQPRGATSWTDIRMLLDDKRGQRGPDPPAVQAEAREFGLSLPAVLLIYSSLSLRFEACGLSGKLNYTLPVIFIVLDAGTYRVQDHTIRVHHPSW